MFGFSAFAETPFAGLVESATGPLVVVAATATDVVSAANTFGAAALDAITASDQVGARLVFSAQISESLAASDLFSVAPSIFRSSLAEAASANETLTPKTTLLASITVSVTATDAFAGRFLWEPVDDVQDAQWTPVQTN